MSKRSRKQRADEETEEAKNNRLRALPAQDAQDLMDAVIAGQAAGVSALGLLMIMDTEGGPQETIVRMALEDAHNLRLTSPRLATIVDTVLGQFFVAEMRAALQRLKQWGGYTCNTIEHLLGPLRSLLVTNRTLDPDWFLRKYGDRIYTAYDEATNADMKVYTQEVGSYVLIRWLGWDMFFSSLRTFLGQLTLGAGREDIKLLSRMEGFLRVWIHSSRVGGDHAYHAILWCLVGNEILQRDKAGLRMGTNAWILRGWAVDIVLHVLLSPTEQTPSYLEFPAKYRLPTMDLTMLSFGNFWFYTRPSPTSDPSVRLLQAAFYHRHPDSELAYSFETYETPTTRLYAARRLARRFDATIQALANLPQRADDALSEPRTLEETYLPFGTYTEEEFMRVFDDLRRRHSTVLRDSNGVLWGPLREFLADLDSDEEDEAAASRDVGTSPFSSSLLWIAKEEGIVI